MRHSIVCLSEIKRTGGLRMDAEHWRPCFIKNSKLVSDDKRVKHYISHDISNIKSSPIHREFEYLEISHISLNSLEHETAPIPEGERPDRAHYILRKKRCRCLHSAAQQKRCGFY